MKFKPVFLYYLLVLHITPQPKKSRLEPQGSAFCGNILSRATPEKGKNMIKDKKNRDITNKIIEVVRTSGTHPKTLSRRDWDSRFFFYCEEFFRDNASLTHTIPAYLSAQVNSNYFGWQKISLSQLDKEKCRPAGQKNDIDGPAAEGVDRYAISEAGYYDKHMAKDVWIRFVQDEEQFLDCFIAAGQLSHNIRRTILANLGFLNCGSRIIPEKRRDIFGLEIVNPSVEIWAHPHGLIAAIPIADNMDYFYEIEMHAKYKGENADSRRFLRRGGSVGYKEGATPENSGVLVYYRSVDFLSIKYMLSDGTIIPHWGQGRDGFESVWLSFCGHSEFNQYPAGSEEWRRMRSDIITEIAALAEQYPLLRQICCNVR